MSQKKNLLEAFTRSDAPSAPPVSAAPPAAPRAPLFGRAGGEGRGPLRPAWALGLIALVGSFVLGYLVGRGTTGEARAEELASPDPVAPRLPPANQKRAFQESPGASPALTEGAVPAAAGRRIEDSPLFEPRNLHTVVVAAYSKSNEDLALATYQHLHEANLPVFPPVASGNLVVVVAGAAPTEGELTKTRDAVRALARDGKKPYADAYLARIDKLIPRTNTKGNE